MEKVHELSPPSKKKRTMSDTTEEINEEDCSDMEPELTQEEQETFDSLLYVFYFMNRILSTNSIRARFIGSSHSPLALVDNEEFIAFLEALNSKYKLPSQ